MRAIMKHSPPAPPALGTRDGLAYALFLPDAEPLAGVVILHGAGSAKESHFDFARGCRDAGMAALAFDARGHGRSVGALGAGMVDDVLSMCALMGEHAPVVALRGSSLGGLLAIHAAARDHGVVAVVAICPAPEQGLLRSLRSGTLTHFEADRQGLERWLESASVFEAVGSLAPDCHLLLLHARGDEQVPHTVSEELFQTANEPKRLLVFPGGHHRSLQHDLEVQAVSRKWIADAAGRRPARAPGGG
jgi:alpha-beta hydrolase superfamily lysophospholipase